MIAQMASFATVDGIGKMNTQFESLNSSMTSNQALQASSLVVVMYWYQVLQALRKMMQAWRQWLKFHSSVDNVVCSVENEMGQLIRTFGRGAKPAVITVSNGMERSNGNPLPAGKYKVKAAIH